MRWYMFYNISGPGRSGRVLIEASSQDEALERCKAIGYVSVRNDLVNLETDIHINFDPLALPMYETVPSELTGHMAMLERCIEYNFNDGRIRYADRNDG